MTHPDATTVRFDPISGPPRRLVFVPRDDGRVRRSTQVYSDGRWRETGSELVESVRVVQPASPSP